MKPDLIILDRDGVINFDSRHYIKSCLEFIPMYSSLYAIQLINQANIPVAIASNQSGIGRSYFDEPMLKKIHNKLNTSLFYFNNAQINYLKYCPHHPNQNCQCRKPNKGMLVDIINYFNLNKDIHDIIFIGDSYTDYQAAKNTAINFSLLLTGNGKTTLEQLKLTSAEIPYSVYDNLLHYVKENL